MKWEFALGFAVALGIFFATQNRPGQPKVAAPKPAESNAAKTTKKETKEKMLTWENLNPENKSPKRDDKVVLTDAEWRAKLTGEQYRILRSHGTDPAFCGLMENHTEAGDYHCAGCDLPLFVSSNKFISKSGWPSFYIPVKRENIWMRSDESYGMVRVEVLCSRCDGHLGHVFPDGPAPSGLRFCINGSALTFKAEKN